MNQTPILTPRYRREWRDVIYVVTHALCNFRPSLPPKVCYSATLLVTKAMHLKAPAEFPLCPFTAYAAVSVEHQRLTSIRGPARAYYAYRFPWTIDTI